PPQARVVADPAYRARGRELAHRAVAAPARLAGARAPRPRRARAVPRPRPGGRAAGGAARTVRAAEGDTLAALGGRAPLSDALEAKTCHSHPPSTSSPTTSGSGSSG